MNARARTTIPPNRILLVSGMPNSGKSTLLREMLRSTPFSLVLQPRGPAPGICIEDDYVEVKLASPHELKKNLEKFIAGIFLAGGRASRRGAVRLLYASAIQPSEANEMPGILEVCDALREAFPAVQILVVQLNPDQLGSSGGMPDQLTLDTLRGRGTEFRTVSARDPESVGIITDLLLR